MSNMIKSDDLSKLSTRAMILIIEEQLNTQESLINILINRFGSHNVLVKRRHINDYLSALRDKVTEGKQLYRDISSDLYRQPSAFEIR